MPRIAIIKPACSALLIPFSISAVPQEAARADAASGHRRFQLAAPPLISSRMRRQRLLRNRLIVDRRSVRSKSVMAAGLESRSQAHIEELPRMSQVTTVTLAAQR